MKIFLNFIALLTLIACLANCSSTAPHGETGKTSTPSSTTPDSETEKTNTPLSSDTSNEQASEIESVSVENNNSACSIEYIFYSIEDMHTYITTGSTNPDDYSQPPADSLEYTLSADEVREHGYRPISDYFAINEALFDSVEASFQLQSDGTLIYSYYLDNMLVTMRSVNNADRQSSLSCYSSIKNIAISDNSVVKYSENISLDNGYVIRSYNGHDIIYHIKDGIKKEACFLTDGYFITVNGTWYSTAESLNDDYYDFMTDSKSSAFASLFTEDQQAFEKAIHNFKSSSME